MLVWTKFWQEMRACLGECELAVLALSHCCQQDGSQGKVQKPCGEGKCCTAPATHAAWMPWRIWREAMPVISWLFAAGRVLNFMYWVSWSSLALGWQWGEQADEFPVLALFSVCHYVPNCTQIATWSLGYHQICRHGLSSPICCCSQTWSLCCSPVNGSSCLCCSGGPVEAAELFSLLDNSGVASFSC